MNNLPFLLFQILLDNLCIIFHLELEHFTPKYLQIAANAFQGKKITTVTIGANIISIGKNAFKNCKQLKKITIQSQNLKSIGKNVFLGIHKKAVIKVPKQKLSAYKTLLKNKGQGKQVKITK